MVPQHRSDMVTISVGVDTYEIGNHILCLLKKVVVFEYICTIVLHYCISNMLSAKDKKKKEPVYPYAIWI